jgi:hypothetical protein
MDEMSCRVGGVGSVQIQDPSNKTERTKHDMMIIPESITGTHATGGGDPHCVNKISHL